MISGIQVSRGAEAPGFIKKIIEWDWDWSIVWEKVIEISSYHVETYGWRAWLAISVVVIVGGMAFPPTRHLTTLILSNLFKGFGYIFGLVFSLFTFKLAEGIWKSLASQVLRTKKALSRDK